VEYALIGSNPNRATISMQGNDMDESRNVAVLLISLCFFLLAAASQRNDKGKGVTDTSNPQQQAPVAVGAGVSPPRAIFAPDPDYPPTIRQGKHTVQGVCILGLVVDERGSVHDVHVVRSLDKRLDQNAMDAVKQWRFQPAMKDGKPVAVFTTVQVEFRLY
jgi:TonB family protein